MNRIKELRKSRGLTQEELTKVLNVQRQTLSKYETGSIPLTDDTIKALTDFFDITADYLLGHTDDPTPPTVKFWSGEGATFPVFGFDGVFLGIYPEWPTITDANGLKFQDTSKSNRKALYEFSAQLKNEKDLSIEEKNKRLKEFCDTEFGEYTPNELQEKSPAVIGEANSNTLEITKIWENLSEDKQAELLRFARFQQQEQYHD